MNTNVKKFFERLTRSGFEKAWQKVHDEYDAVCKERDRCRQLVTYKPPAMYLLTVAESKKDNPVHDDINGRVAYPLYLQKGERGYICFLTDDEKFHRLHTSLIEDVTPWGNGEDTIIVQTMNTKYAMIKL